MKWLPYESWTIDSPLDVPTLVAGMRERIEPTKWFRKWWGSDHTPLQGTIHDRGFSASRVIHYRNSFLPMLYGKFLPASGGTMIRVRMMPHPLVIAFMAHWFGFLGIFGLVGLIVAIQDGTWGFLLPVGIMGGFGLILTYGAFFAEAGKAKNLISQVLLDVHKEAAHKSVQSDEERPAPPPLPRA